MKKRLSFVTNSSSSSYLCCVCGAIESGMDMGLEDADMFTCENGHTICKSHSVDTNDVNWNKEAEKKDVDSYELQYECRPEKYCSICRLEKLDNDNLLKYMLRIHNTNKETILSKIRDTYSNYTQLKEYLDDKS